MSELSVSRNMVLGSKAFAALLELIDKLDSNHLAYTRFPGKDDILALAMTPTGDLDPQKASENLMVMEVDPKLADEFRSAVTKAGIPMSWPTYIEPAKEEGELAKMHSFVIFPRSELVNMQQVVDDFTRKQLTAEPLGKDEMLDWLQKNQQGETQVGKVEIDLELYKFMNRNNMLNIPRMELGENTRDHTMELCVPADMGDGVMETVKMAEALYCGSFKEQEQAREKTRTDLMTKMLSGAKNDLHLSLIVDRSNPSEYITFDKEGFNHYIDTKEGPQLIDRCSRNDRNYEQDLYGILCGMHACKEYEGTEIENMEKLHALQEHGPELQGITVDERVHQLKLQFIDEMMQAGEIIGRTYRQADEQDRAQQEAFKGRMQDDVVKMGHSLDEMSARGMGLSSAAGDLRGDMRQIKGMILSPSPTESIKDLSDLNDAQGWKEMLSEKLFLQYRSPEEQDKYIELFHDLADNMSREEPEVQKEFLNEFTRTTQDIFERNYRSDTEEMQVEMVDLREEISQYRERENELDITR